MSTEAALEALRAKIDIIDQDLLHLINLRANLALETTPIKQQLTGGAQATFQPEREQQILKRLHHLNKGPLNDEQVQLIFKTIIRICREQQMPEPPNKR